MKYFLATMIALCLSGSVLQAQTGTAPATDTLKINRDDRPGLNPGFADGGALHKDKKGGGGSIWVGSGGVHYESGPHDSTYHPFEVQFGMLDLGINSLVDNTQYPNGHFQPGTPSGYLSVPSDQENKELFSLRQSKSVNVNIYPIMLKANLFRSQRQKWLLASGVGLQLYNFRFTKPVTYLADPNSHVILDTVSFSKNKLAFNYLTVPLMLNGKTRLNGIGTKPSEGLWLTYGIGISGGYLLSSWTKQISDERGKEKNHDPFNFSKTNFCVNGEIGLDGYIRLYASYQITALHESVLDQHPFCIGVRFLGL